MAGGGSTAACSTAGAATGGGGGGGPWSTIYTLVAVDCETIIAKVGRRPGVRLK